MREPEANDAAFEVLPWSLGGPLVAAAQRVPGSENAADIIDLTARGDKSVRRGARDPKRITTLVLHQMACCHERKSPLSSYLSLKAHFAILPDGRILQIHPIRELIWASNRFNDESVAVELAGNFPDVRGRWWEGDRFGKNRVSAQQVEAGRRLIRHLMRSIGLRRVVAHRQSSATRENDPGPDVWYHVGQWAIQNLGLSDGGPGFKVGDGNPIPDLWRTWGRLQPAPAAFAARGQDSESDASAERGGAYGVASWG